MGWIVWTVVAGAVLLTILGGRWVVRRMADSTPEETGYNKWDKGDYRGVGKLLGWAAAAWVGLWFVTTLYSSFTNVGSGEVGLVSQFDRIVGQRQPGISLVAPWQDVATVNVKTQHFTFTDSDCDHEDGCHVKDMLRAASKDSQDVFVVGTLNFALSDREVQTLYKTVGANWFETLVKPRVLNALKEETVKYQAQETLVHREDIRLGTNAKLKSELEPYSITVTDFLIENIDFSSEFKQAIEQKQAAEQAALQAQNEADAARNKANGEADATRAKGKAQADANTAIAASITPELVQYQLALAQANWPVQTYLPGGASGVLVSP